MFTGWKDRLTNYTPTETYELGHALLATAVITVLIIFLISCHALLDFLRPAVMVDNAGKLIAVRDHWMLLRSLLLKSAGALAGGTVIGWTLLVINHIAPVDFLKKIGENSTACAIFLGACAIGIAYAWCFG